jgi:hypothetical protein
MSINKQEFTDAGKSMLGRAQAGEVLTISKIVIGSGAAGSADVLWPLTALLHHELDVNIESRNDDGAGTLTVEGSFDSNAAAAAFPLRELGVMAYIGAEAERLYSVANVLTDAPEIVDPASISVHAFKIKLIVDRATTVNVTIGDSGDILAENIGADTDGAGWYKEKILNTLRFKRAVAGSGISITPGTDTVTIAKKELSVDLDLYVPLTNPGGTPETRFPTIQDALNYLGQYSITQFATARVNVAAGVYSQNAQINVNHPQGNRIVIQGPQNATVNFTSLGVATGSTKNWSVPLIGVTDTSKLTVGGWVIVLPNLVTGLNNLPVCGFHKITAIAGSTVTIRVPYSGPTWPGTTSAGSLIPITAIQQMTVTTLQSGIFIQPTGLNTLRYIGFVSPGATGDSHSGVISTGPTVLTAVGVTGFKGSYINVHGIWSNGVSGSISAYSCAATENQDGFVSAGGGWTGLQNCSANGNVGSGIYLEAGGTGGVGSGYVVTTGNQAHGVLINNQSGFGSIVQGRIYSVYNDVYGLSINAQSRWSMNVQAGYLPAVISQNNRGAYDLALSVMSFTSGYPQLSPAYNSSAPRWNVAPGAAISTDGCLVR